MVCIWTMELQQAGMGGGASAMSLFNLLLMLGVDPPSGGGQRFR
jgi:hypothetical protein